MITLESLLHACLLEGNLALAVKIVQSQKEGAKNPFLTSSPEVVERWLEEVASLN